MKKNEQIIENMRRIFLFLVLLLFIGTVRSQDSTFYVRSLHFADGSRSMLFNAVSSEGGNASLEDTVKSMDLSTNSAKYLLIEGEWFLVQEKGRGNIMFDADETIPLDGVRINKKLVSDIKTEVPVSMHEPLKAQVCVLRTIVKKDTVQKLTGRHRGSVVSAFDTVVLYVDKGAVSIPFKLIVNDTLLVEDPSFKTGDTIGLDIAIREKLGLLGMDISGNGVVRVGRIRVAVPGPAGHVSSFIKNVDVVVNEGTTTFYAYDDVNIAIIVLIGLFVVAIGLLFFFLVRLRIRIRHVGKSDVDEEFRLLQQRLKNNPGDFVDDKEYRKLSKLIAKARERDEIYERVCEEPSLIDTDSKTGVLVKAGELFLDYLENPYRILVGEYSESELALLVKKGGFLDDSKNDLKQIIEDKKYVGNSDLQKVVSCVVNPTEILGTEFNNTGLYKLLEDLDKIVETFRKGEKVSDLKLKSGLLEDRYKIIPKSMGRFQKMDEYRKYWENIKSPLFDALNSVHKKDDVYNMRVLMFYASQLYSIADAMYDIYNDITVSNSTLHNVSVFNGDAVPQIDELGLPNVSEESLNPFAFKYLGEKDEDAKRDYFKKFAPMKYLFLRTYYDKV